MQAHTDARTYRVKTVPGFHKLRAIFGEEQSDGRYSRLARNTDLVDLPVLMTSMCIYVYCFVLDVLLVCILMVFLDF